MTRQANCDHGKNKSGTYGRNQRIRELNDQLRHRMSGGQILITDGVMSLGAAHVDKILMAVQTFTAFDRGNDPYAEHDFGAFECAGERVFWKIDYYDSRLEFGSPDPSDLAVTTRVLTIMLASEY